MPCLAPLQIVLRTSKKDHLISRHLFAQKSFALAAVAVLEAEPLAKEKQQGRREHDAPRKREENAVGTKLHKHTADHRNSQDLSSTVQVLLRQE